MTYKFLMHTCYFIHTNTLRSSFHSNKTVFKNEFTHIMKRLQDVREDLIKSNSECLLSSLTKEKEIQEF